MRFIGGEEKKNMGEILPRRQCYLFRYVSSGLCVRQVWEDEGQSYLNSCQRSGRKIKFLALLKRATLTLHLARQWREVAEIWAVGWGYLAIWQFLEAFPIFDQKFTSYKRKAGTRRRRWVRYYKYLWRQQRRLVSGSRFDQFQFYLHLRSVEERVIFSFWYLTNRNFENEVLRLFRGSGERALEIHRFWRKRGKLFVQRRYVNYLYQLVLRLRFRKNKWFHMGKWIRRQKVRSRRQWHFKVNFFNPLIKYKRRKRRGAWK